MKKVHVVLGYVDEDNDDCEKLVYDNWEELLMHAADLLDYDRSGDRRSISMTFQYKEDS